MISSWDKMKVAEHIQQVIEAHLTSPVTLHTLTAGSGYSMYHAAKLFKEVTGETPFAYLRKRRLTEAACSLAQGEKRIIDVAFDFVFDSHEGFTRAFARQFGTTPRGFMNNRPPLSLFFPPSMRSLFSLRQRGEYQMTFDKRKTTVKPVFVQIIERPARKLVLRRAPTATHYFEYCEEAGCDVFEQLGTIEGALHEPMGLWLPESMRRGQGSYAQGVELPESWSGALPEGFEVMDLAPCRLLIFQGEPFDDKEFEQAIEEVWDIMNRYDPATIGYEWADDEGPRFQLEPRGERGYIEGRPVRPLGM